MNPDYGTFMVTQFQQAPSISVLYPYFKMINDLFLLLQAVKFNNLLYLVRTNPGGKQHVKHI